MFYLFLLKKQTLNMYMFFIFFIIFIFV